MFKLLKVSVAKGGRSLLMPPCLTKILKRPKFFLVPIGSYERFETFGSVATIC